MIVLFQNILFLHEFLACNDCFRFTKIKRGLGLAFGAHFLLIFPQKCSLFNIVSMAKVLMSYLLSFSRYQTKCVISSYLNSWRGHKLWDLSSIKLSSNGWQGEKEGRVKIQKFEYLQNEKSFFDEIKNIFHSFCRAIMWWKIKIS